jgi:DNA-binding GntR family transcriptional regulator
MGNFEALAPLRASTLRHSVVDLLVNAILSGRIAPGERLNESALSRQLQVSRAPIREALQHLQEQGLVINKPRRGMFVVSLTDDQITKINDLRIVLEAEALELCRARLDAAFRKKLLAALERLERDAPMTALEATRADLNFHRLIWAHTGNEFLERTLNSLSAPLFAYILVQKPSSHCAKVVLDSHRPLYEFVCGELHGTPPREIMREHVGFGLNRLSEHINRSVA